MLAGSVYVYSTVHGAYEAGDDGYQILASPSPEQTFRGFLTSSSPQNNIGNAADGRASIHRLAYIRS